MLDDTLPAVKLLYFAWVREKIGIASEVVCLPDTVKNVADTIDEHLDVVAEFTVIGGSHDQVLANDDEPGEVNGAPAVEGCGQSVGLVKNLVG